MPAPQYVSVIAPDGQRIDVPESGLQQAIDAGARLETAQEIQARADKQEYGEGIGNELKAGAAGAARTLTLGLSDVIGADIGHGEDLRKLQEQNPMASLAGEAVGAIAPAVLTGGESLLANAAGRAGAGVRAVSAAGQAVEGAAARSLAGLAERGLAGRALATTLSKAAGGAVEGAAFGAGQAVSEAALQDHELTAEQVMQSIGAGALLGGAVAGGIGAAGTLGGAAAASAKKATQAATSRVREIFTGAVKGNDAAKREVAEFAKISSTLTGAPKEELEFFANLVMDPARRAEAEAALAGDEAIMGHARKIAKEQNELETLIDEITDEGRGLRKLEGLQKKLTDNNVQTTFGESANLLQSTIARLDDMETRALNGNEFEVGPIRRARAAIKKVIASTGDPGKEHVNARLFFELDNGKRDLQKITNKASKSARTSSAARDTFEALNEIQNDWRAHLEKAEMWGDAAVAQADVNKPWTRFLQNERYEGADFHVRRSGNSNFEDIYENDPAKWMGFFKRMGTPAADIDTAYLSERLAAQADLVEAMGRQFADSPGAAKKLERIKALHESSAQTMLEAERVSAMQNRFKAIEGDGSISGVAAGALAGWSAGGLKGAIKGSLAAKALSNPQQSLRQMAAAQGFAQRIGTLDKIAAAARASSERLRQSVDQIIGPAKRAAKTASKVAAREAVVITKPGTTYLRASRSDEDPHDLHDARLAELRELAQSPQLAVERLAKGTEQLATVSPQVSQAMQAKAVAVVGFLAGKAPRPATTQASLFGAKPPPVPRDAIAKFDRYVRAATDPSSVIEDLSNGRLSLEAAETMRTLYPKTVDQLRMKLAERMSSGVEIPYQKRLQLSLLFGTPFDPTMEPSFVAAMQANWATPPVETSPQPAAAPVRIQGLGKMSLPNSMKTRAERLMER